MRASTRNPEPGLAARYATECPRCDRGIAVGDRIVYNRGRPVHVACASGQDDES